MKHKQTDLLETLTILGDGSYDHILTAFITLKLPQIYSLGSKIEILFKTWKPQVLKTTSQISTHLLELIIHTDTENSYALRDYMVS